VILVCIEPLCFGKGSVYLQKGFIVDVKHINCSILMVWFPHLVFILHKPFQGVIWVEITLSCSDVLKIFVLACLVDVGHYACLVISALFSLKMQSFFHFFSRELLC